MYERVWCANTASPHRCARAGMLVLFVVPTGLSKWLGRAGLMSPCIARHVFVVFRLLLYYFNQV